MDKFFSESLISLRGIHLLSVVDLIRCEVVEEPISLFKWSTDGLDPCEGQWLQWMYFYFPIVK